MCVTSIQTAADAFGGGALEVGRRPVYEGAGRAGLGLGSPAVTELGAQSQEAGLGGLFWYRQPADKKARDRGSGGGGEVDRCRNDQGERDSRKLFTPRGDLTSYVHMQERDKKNVWLFPLQDIGAHSSLIHTHTHTHNNDEHLVVFCVCVAAGFTLVKRPQGSLSLSLGSLLSTMLHTLLRCTTSCIRLPSDRSVQVYLKKLWFSTQTFHSLLAQR